MTKQSPLSRGETALIHSPSGESVDEGEIV